MLFFLRLLMTDTPHRVILSITTMLIHSVKLAVSPALGTFADDDGAAVAAAIRRLLVNAYVLIPNLVLLHRRFDDAACLGSGEPGAYHHSPEQSAFLSKP